ncbi:MAG TPA: preprotein translocase subunit SecG [Rhizomicrobium sp.]|nr:preprotein translocase subunit SecG [Rhizomicrobium sp.]
MQTVLIVIQLFVSIALIVVVLLQKSEGGAFGMGGSGSGFGGLFSPRGAADTLTRATTVLGILFFLTSIALTILSQHGGGTRPASILDSQTPAPVSAPATPARPAKQPAPSVPKAN